MCLAIGWRIWYCNGGVLLLVLVADEIVRLILDVGHSYNHTDIDKTIVPIRRPSWSHSRRRNVEDQATFFLIQVCRGLTSRLHRQPSNTAKSDMHFINTFVM